MNHRQVIEFAGTLAEQCAEILGLCHHVPPRAMRQFSDAADALFQAWSESIDRCRGTESHGEGGDTAHETPAVFESLAVSGVLLRVGCTLLDAVGRRESIASAIDVASSTIRQYSGFARATLQNACRSPLPKTVADELHRFALRCDRLSDVLCGAMLFHIGRSFAADADRAEDFAHTYSRFPGLVRIPVRQSAIWLPAHAGQWSVLTERVARCLAACFTAGVQTRSRPVDEFTDLTEMFRPRVLKLTRTEGQLDGRRTRSFDHDVAFPTLAFAKLVDKPATS